MKETEEKTTGKKSAQEKSTEEIRMEKTEGENIEEDNTEENMEGKHAKEAKAEESGIPTRSYWLMVLGGIYLVYLGYQLCVGVLNGVEGSSWVFFAVGILFAVTGAAMLFVGARGVQRKNKEKRALEDAQREEKPEEEATDAPKAGDGENPEGAENAKEGKPSISDRANLVQKMNQKDEAEP